MNFKLSNEVSLDLENIWLYTLENWSIKQADRYYNLIMDEIEYIAQNPESGKYYEELRPGYFRSKVKSHLIFYRINQKMNEVKIIRVLHQRMDIETKLSE